MDVILIKYIPVTKLYKKWQKKNKKNKKILSNKNYTLNEIKNEYQEKKLRFSIQKRKKQLSTINFLEGQLIKTIVKYETELISLKRDYEITALKKIYNEIRDISKEKNYQMVINISSDYTYFFQAKDITAEVLYHLLN